MLLRHRKTIFIISTLVLPSDAAFDLFGLRESIYNPRCAHACREPISTSTLDCTSPSTKETSLDCHATDDHFLQTLGFCISRRCKVGSEELEAYWMKYVVGWQISEPAPKYDYQTAVKLAGEPTQIVAWGHDLDNVSVVKDEDYEKSYASLRDWTDNENLHARYALALFICGFLVPIFLSLLRFVPISTLIASKWRAYFIYPTVWSHQWSMQIREAGDISPTRGQACFILYMLALNVGFLATGHYGSMYSFWTLDGRHGQLITCLANRFGSLSLASIPLLFLYAGRNNFLLLATNWSHTTFIMIHRWLGYFVIAEAILHSVLYLNVAVERHRHTAWARVPAWYFGAIATIALSLIIPFSIVYIRKRIYEIFLFVHIAITVLALVGIYFHITYLYNTQISGWVVYLWICVFFWSYDRVARIVRLCLNGVNKAYITVIDEEYIRVDIPSAQGRGHAYLYFPTLTWRFWENHPFSIATSRGRDPEMISYFHDVLPVFGSERPGFDFKTIAGMDDPLSPTSMKSPLSPLTPMTPISAWPLTSPHIPSGSIPSGKSLLSPQSTNHLLLSPGERTPERGLSFFMRTHGGTTSDLRRRTTLPVLVEASYGPPKDLSNYPILVCVAGGVGITAILPYLHAHRGTTRLYWCSRSQGLVNALRDKIHGYNGEVSVGRRLFVKLALQGELARFDNGTPIAIVVSGPKAMCEEVREFCCEVAKKRKGEVCFLDENFSW